MERRSKIIVNGCIYMESANSPCTYWVIPDTPGILDREDVALDIYAEAYYFCTEEAIAILLRHKDEWVASEDPSRGNFIRLPYFAEDEEEYKRKEAKKRKRAEREKRGVKHLTVSIGDILKEKGFA